MDFEICNTFSTSELNQIRDTIEKMNKFNQVEILRILTKHDTVVLNENKYGVHINLTELDEDVINNIVLFIKYVNTQEQTLNSIEKQKENYKINFFSKDIKDNKEDNVILDNNYAK
jgi:hypothetical protein